MGVDEAEGSIVIVKSNGSGAFITCHTREPCFHFDLSNHFYLILVFLLCKHDDIAPYHHFLDDWNIIFS